MKRILFTHSYFLYLDPKQEKTGFAYPPLGTLYAAALAREQGFEVALFDSILAESPSKIKQKLEDFQPDIVVIYDDGFNYLTKMCLTNMREAAFVLIYEAKKQGCKTIISSSDATDHFEKYLQASADAVVLGEGEMTVLDWIKAEMEGLDKKDIPGLVYKENDNLMNNGKRPVLRDLDILPMPAWDLVDFVPYRELWNKKQGYFSLNVATSRGCTYKCNWCAKPLFGNRYHAHTPARVIEELKIVLHNQGASHIWFCDDIFGLKPGWLKEFNEGIQKEKLTFSYKIQSRADLLLDEETVSHLAESGCSEVWIGAESGSQKILDAMDKGTTINQIRQATCLLKKHKIKVCFFLQFGYPGETKEDIRMTLEMVKELLPDEIGISVSYPLPETPFYEKVKGELKQKTNWTDSDEMAMMFSHTYPENFYKELQQFVHQSYRQERGRRHLLQTITKPWKATYSQWRSSVLYFYYSLRVNMKKDYFLS